MKLFKKVLQKWQVLNRSHRFRYITYHALQSGTETARKYHCLFCHVSLISPGLESLFCKFISADMTAKLFQCVNYIITGYTGTVEKHKSATACTANLTT